MFRKASITLRFGLSVIATLIVFFAVFFFLDYSFLNGVLERDLRESEVHVSELFSELFNRDSHMLSATLNAVAASPDYKQLFLQRDRNGLYAATLALFENLHDHDDITHWYFIEPDGTIFLRVHKPDQYGDVIDSATFRRVRQGESSASGLELGKTAFALRSFIPWYDGGKLIGYLEMGEEIEHLVQTFKSEHGSDYAVFGDKEFVDAAQVAIVRRQHGLTGTVAGLRDHVLISESSAELLSLKCISEDNIKKAEKRVVNFMEEMRESGRGCAGAPLVDVDGNTIGVVMFSFEIFEVMAIFIERSAQAAAAFVTFFFGLALVIMAIFWRQVVRPLRILGKDIMEVAKGNLKIKTVVRSDDEIGLLGRNFNLLVAELNTKKDALERMLAGMQATIVERTREAEDSAARYRALIDSAQMCIKLVGRDRKIFAINPYGRKEHFIEDGGPEAAESFDYVGSVKEEYRDQVRSAVEEAFKGKTTTLEFEHEPGKSRSDSCVSILSPIRNSRGEIEIVLFLSSDISERKRAERSIGELNALKNIFIQIVSHQLRTPMNAIRWNLETLLADELGRLKKEQKEFIRVTYEANNEVISRISDLITALDIEEGRVVLNRQETSVESVWQGVIADLKKRADIKGIVLRHAGPAKPLPSISADMEKVRAIFASLADNAASYTPAGGAIESTLSRRADRIRLEIKDTGIGIPAIEQSRVFTRFFRASNASTMKPDASGLGLFIAKHFAEQHGGTVGFESNEGAGSMFWFEIPIKKRARSEAKAAVD